MWLCHMIAVLRLKISDLNCLFIKLSDSAFGCVIYEITAGLIAPML